MDPFDRSAPPPPKRGLGCFAKGCLTLLIVGGVLIGLGIFFTYQGYQKVRGYLADQPANIRVYPATDAEYQAVEQKLAPFLQGIETNRRATVELTGDELNTLVAREPGFSGLRGKAYFSLAQGYLTMDFSRSLGNDRRARTYYLNGKVTTAVNVDAGEVKVSPQSAKINGQAVPAWIMQAFNNRDFMKQSGGILDEEINRNPKLRDFLRHLRKAHVDGEKLVLTSAGEPVAATPAAP